jgi:hypothetical protein
MSFAHVAARCFPIRSRENVDPQMPSERLPRPCARDFNEKSSLPLQGESERPKLGGILRRIRYFPQRAKTVLYQLVSWLCWQSAANPSLPANLGNAGRFRKIAGKAPAYCCRKRQHLRALDSLSLPSRAGRTGFIAGRRAERIRFSVHTAISGHLLTVEA